MDHAEDATRWFESVVAAHEGNTLTNRNVITKPRSFMGDYIAMHGHLTQRDRPNNMDHMPRNTIYIRDDIRGRRKQRVILHECREMRLMEKGDTYKRAHRKAGY